MATLKPPCWRYQGEKLTRDRERSLRSFSYFNFLSFPSTGTTHEWKSLQNVPISNHHLKATSWEVLIQNYPGMLVLNSGLSKTMKDNKWSLLLQVIKFWGILFCNNRWLTQGAPQKAIPASAVCNSISPFTQSCLSDSPKSIDPKSPCWNIYMDKSIQNMFSRELSFKYIRNKDILR